MSIWKAASVFVFVVLTIAVAAWLTLAPEDPCADISPSVGAAVLAESDGDQDALVNTAILRRADCPDPQQP